MAAVVYHHVIGTIQFHRWNDSSGSQNKDGQSSLRMVSKGSGNDKQLLVDGNCYSRSWKFCVFHESASESSTTYPVQSTSSNSSDSQHISDESALILMRHGESMWNVKNLFTGCVDVPLTTRGVEEAIQAGKRICNIPVDIIYTSALIRAQMTAMLAMTQHREKKVPIVMHNEFEEAQLWNDGAMDGIIPVTTAWQLNERMYGDLQGLNKEETAAQLGKEIVYEWRRSYHMAPPRGESLEMCGERAVSYFKKQIEPQLKIGKNVMVAAHANSLRSIIMYLDELSPVEVRSLNIFTGIPMLYIYRDGKFIRRGSPVAPSEHGVYAYTMNLAVYRQKLDEVCQ